MVEHAYILSHDSIVSEIFRLLLDELFRYRAEGVFASYSMTRGRAEQFCRMTLLTQMYMVEGIFDTSHP